MWGIDVGAGEPGKHLEFKHFRSSGGDRGKVLIDQLMGR